MAKTDPQHDPALEQPAPEAELTPEQLAELGFDPNYVPPTGKQLIMLGAAGVVYLGWLVFLLAMAKHG